MTTVLSSTLKTSSSQAKSSPASATAKPAKSTTSLTATPVTASQPKRSSKSASAANLSSSSATSAEHHCEHCGSSAVQLKHVTRSFDKGATLMVVEAIPIPMWSCPSCGESYFFVQTRHEFERIKILRKLGTIKRAVPVAFFESTLV